MGFSSIDYVAKCWGYCLPWKMSSIKKKLHSNKGFHLIQCFIDLHLSTSLLSRVSKKNWMLIHGVYTTVLNLHSCMNSIHLRFYCVFCSHQKRLKWCRPPIVSINTSQWCYYLRWIVVNYKNALHPWLSI